MSSYPTFLSTINDRVVFAAGTDQFGFELWSSDGTEAGTALLRDLVPGAGSSSPQRAWLTEGGGYFYFIASTAPYNPRNLWRTDGTEAGTVQLTYGQSPLNLVGFLRDRGLTVFAAEDVEHGIEPWVTDGTPAGTHLLADLEPGPGSGSLGTGRLVDDGRHPAVRRQRLRARRRAVEDGRHRRPAPRWSPTSRPGPRIRRPPASGSSATG